MFTTAIILGGLLRQRVAKRPPVNAWLLYGRLDYLKFLCEHFIGHSDYDYLDH